MRVFSSRNIRRSGMALAMVATVGLTTGFTGANTGQLTVTASVAAVCLIGNATLAFGAYNPTSGTAVTATTNVTLTCTLSTPFGIGMSAGAATGATVTTRAMQLTTSASTTLGYGLYQDAGHTINWTNATNSYTATSSASSLTNTVPIYGQIPASEAAPVGNYTDTVVMTVNF
jgi:spore coat protein U-like protein